MAGEALHQWRVAETAVPRTGGRQCCEFGTRVTMADDAEPHKYVGPRPVQPLELPAYAWLLVKQYSYRHELWCKVMHYGFCGQSCPCCRFAAGDLIGACEVGLGVRTLASVSAAVRVALTDSIGHGPQQLYVWAVASSSSSSRPQQLTSRSRSPRQRLRTTRSSLPHAERHCLYPCVEYVLVTASWLYRCFEKHTKQTDTHTTG